MAKVKRSVWKNAFDGTVASARRLIKHPKELRRIIEEAAVKTQQHSGAIREIAGDFQLILRLVKAWLAGEYKDISAKSILILIGGILYFLNPFDAIPDTIPVLGYVDDVAVVGWVITTLKEEIDEFKKWEKRPRSSKP